MKKIYKVTFLIILGMFLSNCENKKAEEIEREKIATGLLVKVLTNNSVASSTPNVSSSCRSGYSTLLSSLTACTGCHASQSPVIKDTEESFSAVIAKITPDSPSSSPLYIKITTGSMAVNSNGSTNADVLAWITSCKP